MLNELVINSLPKDDYVVFIDKEGFETALNFTNQSVRLEVQLFPIQGDVADYEDNRPFVSRGYLDANPEAPDYAVLYGVIEKVLVNDDFTKGQIFLSDGSIILFNADLLA